MRTRRRFLAPILCALAVVAPAVGQAPATAPTDDLREALELFRSDVNAAKVVTLNDLLRLDEAEAAKFWPIYREYELDLAALGDRKVALIREFVSRTANGTLDDASSALIAEDFLDLQQDRISLWRRYHKKIARAISPLRAGQFLQVENQMALLIDINIAAEMPAVGAASR
jgi:hypothetical protein